MGASSSCQDPSDEDCFFLAAVKRQILQILKRQDVIQASPGGVLQLSFSAHSTPRTLRDEETVKELPSDQAVLPKAQDQAPAKDHGTADRLDTSLMKPVEETKQPLPPTVAITELGSKPRGPHKVLPEELTRSSETAQVEGLVKDLESQGALEHVEPVEVLAYRIITRCSLLKSFSFGDVHLTVPFQTLHFAESKGLGFLACLTEPWRALPPNVSAASRVVELLPHHVDCQFPVPVLVEIPWDQDLASRGHLHTLSFWVLETPASEWRKVDGGRFRDGKAHIMLHHFCQVLVAVLSGGFVEVTFSSWMRRAPRPDGRYDAVSLVALKDCQVCEERSDQLEDQLYREGFRRAGVPPDLDCPLDCCLPPKCTVCITPDSGAGEEIQFDFASETILVPFNEGLQLRAPATTFSCSVSYTDADGRLRRADVAKPHQGAATEPASQPFVVALASRLFPLDAWDKEAKQRAYKQGISDVLDVFDADGDATWFFCMKEKFCVEDPDDALEKLLKEQELGELLIFHGLSLEDHFHFDTNTEDVLTNEELVELFRERRKRGLGNPRCLFLACCYNSTRARLLSTQPLGIEYIVYFEGGAIHQIVVAFQKHFLEAVKERRRLFRGPLNFERAFTTAKRAVEDRIRCMRDVQIASLTSVLEKLKCFRSPTVVPLLAPDDSARALSKKTADAEESYGMAGPLLEILAHQYVPDEAEHRQARDQSAAQDQVTADRPATPRKKILPSVRALQISAANLVRVLQFEGGVTLTVPLQTWKQVHAMGYVFKAEVVPPPLRQQLPPGAMLQSQVIGLSPHLRGWQFPIPVRVSVPHFEIKGCLGPRRALRAMVLEHEEGKTEWEAKVMQCRFKKGMAHVYMDSFCDLAIFEEDAQEVEVDFLAYRVKEQIGSGIYKGLLAITRKDCSHCQRQWEEQEERWRTDRVEKYELVYTALDEEQLPGSALTVTSKYNAEGKPPHPFQFKGGNAKCPVSLKFNGEAILYELLREDEHPIDLWFQNPGGPQLPEPTRRSPVKGCMLWASRDPDHPFEPSLDIKELERCHEIGITVIEMERESDIESALTEESPELLIFSGHNEERAHGGALVLQCEKLAHEQLAQLLQQRAAAGKVNPCCVLLAVCHGEPLAKLLIAVEGVELVIFWRDSSSKNGVPNQVASRHTEVFLEKLLESQQDGLLRFVETFGASREALATEFLEGNEFATLRFWARPDREQGALLQYITKSDLVAQARPSELTQAPRSSAPSSSTQQPLGR